MKILIVNVHTKKFDVLSHQVNKYLRLKSIIVAPIFSIPRYMLIDEKKRMVHGSGDLKVLMQHVGWLGNVMMVNSHQFLEHVDKEQQKEEYPNAVGPVAQHVKDMFERPLRNPCKHCKKVHADYPCDGQIDYIRLQLNRPIDEIKKICKGCNNPMIICSCSEHEKECIDCP